MHAVAAIDVGSNATRLATLWVTSTGVVSKSEFERFAVRLGTDVFSDGKVGPERQAALAQVFADIAARLKEYRINAYRAVATSAMRDAQNGAALVDEIYRQSRITVEIIAGVEESRLSRLALERALGTVEGETLLLDLGGGSLEVERASGRRGRSLPLGTVRLLERFPQLKAPLQPAGLVAVRQEVLAEVRRHVKHPRPAPLAIGTGGNLDTLANLLAVPDARLPSINLSVLSEFAERVAGMDNEARVQTFGVRADRADLILPAVLVILALVELFQIQRLVVPGTGLREAMLYDLVTPADPGCAARRLLAPSSDLGAQARRSAKLGRELFVVLAALHGLWPPAMQPFLTAVHLWHFGAFLDPRDAPKHALYVLNNVRGLDLDPRAEAVAGFALQKLMPEHADAAWTGAEEDANAARAIAGLLRLTLALAPLARRTSALEVDVLAEPVTILADLSAPLDPAALAPLQDAVSRRIVIR